MIPAASRALTRLAARTAAGPWPAVRACVALTFVALLLIAAGDLLLDRYPSRVQISAGGDAAAVSIGGVTRVVPLDRPVQGLRFLAAEDYIREYQIDGSDTTNNFTFDRGYFDAFSATPYYRFQSWLRDESSFSTWRNLTVRDTGARTIIRQARPATGEILALPAAFELTVDLHRPEAPRTIDLVGADDTVVHVDVNRNDKYVKVSRSRPEEPDAVLASWYYPFDWQPALAGVLHLLLRSCAIGLLLVVLLVPIAAFLPRQAALVPGRWPRLLVPIVAVGLILGAAALMSVAVFDKRMHIYDAMSYYFQGKIFASGHLSAPVPAVPEAFPIPFTVFHQGRWFSMYSPGTPLVLAVGFLVGLPWLVEPTLAAAGALLIYSTARRQYGLHTALLAIILVASSPFLRIQAGSFLSHVPGMFWGAVLLYAASRYVERPRRGWVIAGAAALGFLFLTREMSAIIYAASVGGYLAWRGVVAWRRTPAARRGLLADLATAGIWLALFAAAYLGYNQALTGSPTLLPRTLFSVADNKYGFGEGVGFYGRHTPGAGLVNADEMLTSLTVYLFGWPFYLTLALIALPFLLRRARTWDYVHGALAGGFVLAYIGLYYHGIAYGPRYYFDALPSLVILSARGFVTLAEAVLAICRRGGRGQVWPQARTASLLLCTVLLACNALYFWPQQARIYRPYSGRPGTGDVVLADLLEQYPIARRPGDRPVMIVLRERDLVDAFGPLNCPRLDCTALFAYSPDEDTDQRLRAAYPGRDWFRVQQSARAFTISGLGATGGPPAR